MDQFPSNSRKARDAERDPKRVERVVSATAVRRKRSLGKQFRQTFIGGDARTAVGYVVANVLIPAAQEAMLEAWTSGFEKLIYGEHRRARGRMPGSSLGHVSYNQMSRNPPQS